MELAARFALVYAGRADEARFRVRYFEYLSAYLAPRPACILRLLLFAFARRVVYDIARAIVDFDVAVRMC